MVGGRVQVRVTQAPERAQVVIRWMGAVEQEVGRVMTNGARWTDVEKMGGCVEGFHPIFGWHVGLDEESADDVISGPNGALGLAVLRRRVRA